MVLPYTLINIETINSDNSLSVLTYNLEQKFTDVTIQEIVTLNPDIIALQEYSLHSFETTDGLILIGNTLYYYFNDSSYDLSIYGLMIYSRFPIIQQQFIELPDNPNQTPRGFLETIINVDNQ